MRILVVEDNANLSFGLSKSLEAEGYSVTVAEDGTKGFALAREVKPDLIVLDLMLPGMDGYEVLRRLRGAGQETPVLILSARGEEADKVHGFRLGADDYVTKPFSLSELLARVRAIMRRAKNGGEGTGAHDEPNYAFGAVELHPSARQVMRDGKPVTLSPKEFDLLLSLVKRKGAVASRMELLQEVWAYDSTVVSRTVDTHIAELRRKLEVDPAHPVHILTVWKRGYRLQA